MRKICLFLLIVVLVVNGSFSWLMTAAVAQSAPTPPPAPFSDWTKETPNPPGVGTLRDLLYTPDGTFMVVGWNGFIGLSNDGVNWTKVTPSTVTASFNAVTYGNGIYVAVGAAGKIFRSTDGLNWTEQTSGTISGLNSVAYGNGEFIAVGGTGVQLRSNDGITWTSFSTGINNTGASVFYLNGTWLIGYNISAVKSTDGVTWTQIVGGPSGLYAAIYADGKYFLASRNGKLFSSATLADNSFTQSNSYFDSTKSEVSSQVSDLIYKDGVIYGVDLTYGKLFSTTDGVTVNSTYTGFSNVYALIHEQGKFIVVTSTGSIVRSTDGVNWDAVNSGFSNTWNAIIAAPNGDLLAVGSSSQIQLKQGSNPWKDRAWNSNLVYNVQTANYLDGKYILFSNGLRKIESTDARQWSATSAATAAGSETINSVVYDGTQYVAAGSSTTSQPVMFISPDLDTWTVVATPAPTTFGGISYFKYGNGVYVAARNADTKVYISTDLTNWTTVNMSSLVSGLEFIDGYFYATLGSGNIARSVNGSTWTTVRVSATEFGSMKTLSFGNNMFFVAGQSGKAYYSRTFTNNWTPITTGETQQFNDSIFLNGKFYVVGNGGVTYSATVYPAQAVTYEGNSNTGGSVPIQMFYSENDTVTVSSNSGNLVKSGKKFAGWNTEVDGTGTSYAATDTFTMGTTPITLYAQWTDAGEAPADISLSNVNVAENSSIGSVVGTFNATDQDTGDTFTYSLVSGSGDTDNSKFSIDGTSLKVAASLNYESNASHSIRVEVSDGSLTYTETFTITVTNVNEAPTDISLSANTIAENGGTNATIGTLSGIDPDANPTLTYSLVSGTGDSDNGSFNINGTSLRANSNFDFESKSSYSVRVQVSDGSLTYEKVFTVNVSNVNEAPTDISLSANTVNDNSVIGTTVATLTAKDQDAGAMFTYSLVSGEGDIDNAGFAIDDATLKTTTAIDYETKTSYSIRVQVSDGELTVEKSFPITVVDVAEAPAFMDVPFTSWYSPAVEHLANMKVLNGNGLGKFFPEKKMTRAEFAKMLVTSFEINTSSTEAMIFSDMTNADAWYHQYVLAASRAKIVGGFPDGTFQPNKAITRQEMMLMLHRAIEYKNLSLPIKDVSLSGFKDADQANTYAKSAIEKLVKGEIVTGINGLLKPKSQATRAEGAVLIYRVLKQQEG